MIHDYLKWGLKFKKGLMIYDEADLQDMAIRWKLAVSLKMAWFQEYANFELKAIPYGNQYNFHTKF